MLRSKGLLIGEAPRVPVGEGRVQLEWTRVPFAGGRMINRAF